MSSYQYCKNCHMGLDEPTIRQAIAGSYDCPNCGESHDTLTTNEDALNKLVDRLDEISVKLGIKVEEDSPYYEEP